MFDSNMMLRKSTKRYLVGELRMPEKGALVSRACSAALYVYFHESVILRFVAHPEHESYWHVIARTCGACLIPGWNSNWFLVLYNCISSLCPAVRLYYYTVHLYLQRGSTV